MFKHLLWVVLFTIFSFPKAHAFVFIEPLVGYSTGTLKMDASHMGLSLRDSLDLKGLNYGVRGGLQLGGLQLGVDYVQNDLKASGSSLDLEDEEFKVQELAAFLGYRFWFMRLYGGVIFRADAKDSDLDPGVGFKAGLSFYALRHVALNLEYKKVNFGYITDPDTGVVIDTEYDQVALLLSFPFGT